MRKTPDQPHANRSRLLGNDGSISERATAQADRGVTTLDRLRSAGITNHAINTRCRPNGPWQRLFGKVVLLQRDAPSREQLLRAALAHFGEATVLTGLDALRGHGADLDPPSGAVQVLLPVNRRVVCPPEFAPERTTRLPTVIELDGLPLATPARACIDTTRRLTDPRAIQAVLLGVLRDGLCSVAELEVELELGSQRGAAKTRNVLRYLSGKLSSITEAKAARIVSQCRIPPPCWHVELSDADQKLLTVASAHWPDVELSWDISADGHHAAVLRRRGKKVVHTPPATVLQDPARVRELLERAYVAAGGDNPSRQSR